MNIVIVGGGSAGWMSALFIQKLIPKSNITLIQSSSVDIIGVGESTTPPIINLFDFINISISDLIINAGATFKSSIKFTNWNGDNTHYFHGYNTLNSSIDFYLNSKVSPYTEFDFNNFHKKSYMAIYECFLHKNLDEIHASSVMSMKNKVPISFNEENSKKYKHPIFHFNRHVGFALHFNARLLAKYLQKIGIERGIKVIDGLVSSINCDEIGNVNELILNDNRKISCDFIFDCSGMARILVDNHFKSELKSYSNHLPVKKAIPFFIENDDKTPVYTEAIAMKYGWIWKIPVEGRFGCGYVFDSDYITSDDAYREASELFGRELDVSKTISFKSGYFTKPWNKNVLAIGLASGFIEPLEATSIWMTTMSLFLLTDNLAGMLLHDKYSIDNYNKIFIKNTDSVLNLVYTHYLNQRNDSNFWKEFRHKNPMPDSLKELFDNFKHRVPSIDDIEKTNLFSPESWFVVCAGNKLLCKKMIEKEYIVNNIENNIKNKIDIFKNNLSHISSNCMDHDDLLQYLRNHENG